MTLAALLLGSGSLLCRVARDRARRARRRAFGFGAGFGAINVSANAQGLALERLSGRPILSSFHAAFSAGGLVGAGHRRARRRRRDRAEPPLPVRRRGSRRDRRRAVRFLLPPEADDRAKSRTFARPPRAIVVLGAAAFCTMLAEGAAADWSAVYLTRSFGAAAGVAALAYTAFALAMTTSRTSATDSTAATGR